MATLKDIDFEDAGTLTSYGFSDNVDVPNQLNNLPGVGVGGSRGMGSTSGVNLQAILDPGGTQGREGSAEFDFFYDPGYGSPYTFFYFSDVTTPGVALLVDDSNDHLIVKNGASVIANLPGLLTPGQYHHVELRWKLKSSGNTDGELRILINDVLTVSLSAWDSNIADQWTVLRFLSYQDIAYDNIFVTDTFEAIGATGPEPVFENATLSVGLTWMILTARSGTQYVWSDRPLPDPVDYYLGWKEPRVIRWGRIRSALSNVLDGQYETTDFSVTLSDTDRLMRQLDADKELVNATVAVYMIEDEGRRALQTAKTVYRGVVRDAVPRGTLEYDLSIKDPFQEKFSSNDLIPSRVVNTTDFANSAATLVNSSAEGYVVNGNISLGSPPSVSDIPVRDGHGVFAEGDKIRVGAFATIYTVASMSSCFGTPGGDVETYISVDPVLQDPLSDGDAIVQIPSHQVEPAVGKRVPFWYGYLTDRNVIDGIDAGDGQAPMLYVGDKVLPDGKTYGEFLWGGHACFGGGGSPSDRPFTMLYFWNEALDDLVAGYPLLGDLAIAAGAGGRIALPGYDNWTTTNSFSTSYRDYNGRRYTVLYLRGIFRDWALGIRMAPPNLGGVPFAVNAYGQEDVGDGSGDLIDNGLDQYLHTVLNWCPPEGDGYQSGPYLASPTFADDPTLPMIDEPSFTTAHNQSKVYTNALSPGTAGGFRGDFGVGVNNEGITARDLLARFNLSFGVQCGFNSKTQFFVDLVNTDLLTTTLRQTLGYVRDIFSGTFEIEPVTRDLYTAIDYRHTQDYLGRERDGWRSVESGETEVFNGTTQFEYGAKTTYSQLKLYMVRGKNRSTDADDYERGTYTAQAVLALTLARLSSIQHLPKLQTGPAGFNYELGQVVPLTHYEGLSSTGWTERPMRIERREVDPTEYVTVLEGYDLDPMLA